MTVYDFVALLGDDLVTIAVWDYTAEEEVFCGEAVDTRWKDWTFCEILAIDFDPLDKRGVSVILNIETGAD